MNTVQYVWQIPISHWDRVRPVAHLLPLDTSRNRLRNTPCGKQLNPGFAAPITKATRYCATCQRSINRA